MMMYSGETITASTSYNFTGQLLLRGHWAFASIKGSMSQKQYRRFQILYSGICQEGSDLHDEMADPSPNNSYVGSIIFDGCVLPCFWLLQLTLSSMTRYATNPWPLFRTMTTAPITYSILRTQNNTAKYKLQFIQVNTTLMQHFNAQSKNYSILTKI